MAHNRLIFFYLIASSYNMIQCKTSLINNKNVTINLTIGPVNDNSSKDSNRKMELEKCLEEEWNL